MFVLRAALPHSLLAALLLAVGCARKPVPAPYPHESVLTVVAELQIFLNQDPYRDPPGTDLAGRNIYRVTLERLDNLAALAPAEYADVLAFARGAALERMGGFEAGAAAFALAATTGTQTTTHSLAGEAARRAALARRLHGLTDRAVMGKTLESYLNDLEVLGRNLATWRAEAPPFPYDRFVRAEEERALSERIKLLADNRLVLERGMPRALELARRLVAEHAESRRAGEHDLQLGGLFETLARDLSAAVPPESQDFNAEGAWAGYIDQARTAYTRAAQRDGDAAKPEAQARLRALDAYALRVQALAR